MSRKLRRRAGARQIEEMGRYLMLRGAGRILSRRKRMATSNTLSTLNGNAIRKLGIVERAREGQFRAASYDLTIGHIVKPDGELANEYILPAQGIVEVISSERLSMPSNVFANALIKTSMSNQGLLALGIGVVDPGYHGRISSFIVNFSKDSQVLTMGESFLRCIFHYVDSEDLLNEFVITDEDYILQSKKRVVANFSKSFLNTEMVTQSFIDAALKKYRAQAIVWIPIIGFGLALITFLLNFGSFAAMQRWIDPRVEAGQAAAVSIESRLDEISERLDALEGVRSDEHPSGSEADKRSERGASR